MAEEIAACNAVIKSRLNACYLIQSSGLCTNAWGNRARQSSQHSVGAF